MNPIDFEVSQMNVKVTVTINKLCENISAKDEVAIVDMENDFPYDYSSLLFGIRGYLQRKSAEWKKVFEVKPLFSTLL